MIDIQAARVDEKVWERYPDYAALVMTVAQLQPGPSSHHSETLLREAERQAQIAIGDGAVHDLPEVARWREAYASFGVKPRDARSSVEALMRRADKGLPRIDRLTDVYNAISVMHRIPIGGENLDAYIGPPQLVISDGSDTFDAMRDGQRIDEIVPEGEVVWRDDAGVTCRRWNWRQCVRTRLDDQTERALFIIDGLGPDAESCVMETARALVGALSVESPDLLVDQVLLRSVPRP